ncbi:MAG: MerR family transcriptional regulator [Oscillatoriaceae cyanobacterium Prado104]|jgi:effector-binding domain-containing protein|nr:MerR family transcriptional regulator [Oscillatoriaceae cyanobacterium Prado104]
MLKIGDFSKLSLVSIKALRLYDRMGLLKPTRVDRANGYRYYSASQLPRLNRILAFKDLGFSLEQIGQLLDDQISPVQMRGMLRLKQAELQQHIQGETARLARVEARLRQIELEGNMPNYEVVLKKIQPMTVASIREILPNYSAVGKLFDDLTDYLQQHGVKADSCAAIWHDTGYKETDVDGEAIVIVDKLLPGSDRIKFYELPALEQAASVIYQGSYNTIAESYNYLLSWIETSGYQIVGPNREIYIQGGPEQDNESYVTEILFPVEKICRN